MKSREHHFFLHRHTEKDTGVLRCVCSMCAVTRTSAVFSALFEFVTRLTSKRAIQMRHFAHEADSNACLDELTCSAYTLVLRAPVDFVFGPNAIQWMCFWLLLSTQRKIPQWHNCRHLLCLTCHEDRSFCQIDCTVQRPPKGKLN